MKNKALYFIFIAGLVVPFMPSFVVFEMFFMLIPFGILFVVAFINMIVSFLKKDIENRKSIFLFSILPIFIISQLLSVFMVKNVQKIRSEKIILKLEKIKDQSGKIPENFKTTLGITYVKENGNYIIKYSSGFLIHEKYSSQNKKWERFGWND